MKKLALLTSLLLCGSLSAAVFAEPPEGRGWKKHKHKHEHYAAKEEYWDGNCKVERKWKRNGDYEEERKCRGDRYYDDHEHRRVDVVVLPPWFDQRAPEPEYRPEWRPQPRRTSTRCNSEKVGRVLGGIIGGVIGHQIGDGRGNTAATIGGAIAGVLVGGKIGERMDQRNQACVAQALEFAPEGQRITWDSEQGHERYAVTPGPVQQRGDRYCRPFTAEVMGSGEPVVTNGSACRQPDGTWVQSQQRL
ncbi:glycine zipper 2TM domain-containing protein [Microbulbifer yueqingensis]|uniref:Surface antigen n=1 Tax=Microbulbifer yueqingensis TaxID=658219 RepID=A0A1G8V285_9GAMM|nr:glycine zipper 2TM domain-containing protein [Microbulbifer yueqingensis]SDJ60173.1 Surface antigen [Microbulbifer yueqingensis]